MKRKRSEMRKATDAIFGGAMALQSVNVLKDVKAGASLTGHIGTFTGIGIAGALSNVALNMMERSAYPINKKDGKTIWR